MKNIRDSYKSYKKEVRNPIDIDTYVKLTADYNEFLTQKVLEGYEVTLPARMGTLLLKGKKIKPKLNEKGQITNLTTNWKATLDLWEKNPQAKEQKKVIKFLNEETNGVRYSFFWSKWNVYLENKYLYSLRMVRRHKRSVKPAVESGKEYTIVER